MMTHEEREVTINRKTTITLAVAITAVVGAIGVTWRAFEAFDEVKKEITTLRTEILEQNNAEMRRIENIESELDRRSGDRWTGAMMEIWVLRSRQSGEFVDPAPIIERHTP